jgi:hypothetical protein
MVPSSSSAHARLAIAAIVLLLPACGAPRRAGEREVGRWQIERSEGNSTFLVDTATGELWVLQARSGGGHHWVRMARAPGTPEPAGSESTR